MEIRKLDHAALLVKDIERSRRFYGKILGLEEIPRPQSFSFPGAWFRIGSQELHLIGEAEAGRTKQVQPGGYRPDELERGYGAHIAFAVNDLQLVQQQMRSNKIEIVGGPRPRGDGVMQMYVCDPDGYVVEFFVWPTMN